MRTPNIDTTMPGDEVKETPTASQQWRTASRTHATGTLANSSRVPAVASSCAWKAAAAEACGAGVVDGAADGAVVGGGTIGGSAAIAGGGVGAGAGAGGTIGGEPATAAGDASGA